MPYLGTNYGILFGVYHSYTTLILYIKCRHTWKVHRVYKNISLSFFFVVLSYWWKGYNHLYFFFNHLKFFILRYTQAVRLVLHLYSWIAKDLQYYFNRLITFLLDSFRAHNSLLYTWVPQSPPLTLSSCFNIFIQKQLGTCFLEFSLSLTLSPFFLLVMRYWLFVCFWEFSLSQSLLCFLLDMRHWLFVKCVYILVLNEFTRNLLLKLRKERT